MPNVVMHQVKTPPLDYLYSEPSELEDWHAEDLEKLGVEECWYWYERGSYDGSGYIVYRTRSGWHTGSLGHCSCYTATANLDVRHPLPSWRALLADMSNEANVEYSTIISALQTSESAGPPLRPSESAGADEQ